MIEQPPGPPERHLGTYRQPRDEALHVMAVNEWANESGGDASSPTGKYYRVSNSEAELQEIVDTFAEEFGRIDGLDPQQLVGQFVVLEKQEGFVDVQQFPDEDEATAFFKKQERVYKFWQDIMGLATGDEE